MVRAGNKRRFCCSKSPEIKVEIKPEPQIEPQLKIEPQPEPQIIRPQFQPQQESEPKMEPRLEPTTEDRFNSVLKPEPVIQQPQTQVQINQPASQPQPKPQTQFGLQDLRMDQEPMPAKRKSHLALKLAVVLIVLSILGGAGYIVAGQYISLPKISIPWNFNFSTPITSTSDTTIKNMLANLNTVKSLHTTIQGNINVSDSNKNILNKLAVKIDGDSGEAQSSFNVSTELNTPGYSTLSSLGSTDVIYINNAAYFKFTNIDIPSNYYGFNSASISEKWLTIDQNSLEPLYGSSVQTGFPENLILKIKNIISSENVLSNVKKIDEQVVGGQNTYHYSGTIKNEKLKTLTSKIAALLPVDYLIRATGDINIEMWIGKTNYMLYQIKIAETPIDASKFYSNTGVNLTAAFVINNSDFNKTLAIQEPQGAQKMETVLASWLKSKKIKATMSQIESVAQTLLSTKQIYSTLCKAGQLNGYLKMGLQGFANDIISQGGTRPVCFSEAQNYCVSSQLSDGSQFCVGVNGAGKTKCLSTKTVCQ